MSSVIKFTVPAGHKLSECAAKDSALWTARTWLPGGTKNGIIQTCQNPMATL